ncbi:hypothetical protein BS47DRAFT_1342211 [Hydnum rufescens UP504]|uniref:Fungal N-terminal domain-containing protein n=1 Tax=Hydnum rufescens UP504 TaxID=1448309 RepID=A0A9P6B081_9AGAM|nr:hypothetical protein BS47DRAFT_1342211 [Hydnum rufescens UP504]
MAASLLSVASTSLQLVISAYEQVKSNKERCRNLDVEGAKIERLREAFEHITQTITRVGARGWFKRCLAIDECHHRISDLITLLNLHELVDVARWDDRSKYARRKDQEALLQAVKQIEKGNRVIARQLKQQSYMLADLWGALMCFGSVFPSSRSFNSGLGITSGQDELEIFTSPSPGPSTSPLTKKQPPSTIPSPEPFPKRSRSSSTASIISTKYSDSYRDTDHLPSSSHGRRQRHASLPVYGFSYDPPSSDVSISQLSHKADRLSDSSTQCEGDQWDVPVPGPSVGTAVSAIPRGTGVEPASTSRDENESLNVEVFLVADVPESGFILDYADTIGSTSLTVLRAWTDASRFVSQTIRFEGHDILLRTSPATNPYLILCSSSPPQPSAALPPSSTTTPQSPTLTLVERRVFLTCSLEPVTLVLLFHHHSVTHRAVFLWPASITVREMKADLSTLVTKASKYAGVTLFHKYPKVIVHDISVVSGMLMETKSLDDGMTLGQCGVTFAITSMRNEQSDVIQGSYLRADIGYVPSL